MKSIVKRLGAILLALALTAGALPPAAAVEDYSRYVGLWTYNETKTADGFGEYNWYSKLNIKSISGGCVNFDLTGGREFKNFGPSRVAVISNVTTGAISDNQAGFSYEDSWGNSGYGAITFREDGVTVSVTVEKVGTGANYSMSQTPLGVLLQMEGFTSGPAASGAPGAVRSPQGLNVNGKDVECEKYNIGGSNYFKLRDLACMLSGTASQFGVGYDEATATVTITTGAVYTPNGTELKADADNSATAKASRQTILIDGEKRGDLTVYNIGGSNFFQLRELGGALGFEVGYDADTNTALITSADTFS